MANQRINTKDPYLSLMDGLRPLIRERATDRRKRELDGLVSPFAKNQHKKLRRGRPRKAQWREEAETTLAAVCVEWIKAKSEKSQKRGNDDNQLHWRDTGADLNERRLRDCASRTGPTARHRGHTEILLRANQILSLNFNAAFHRMMHLIAVCGQGGGQQGGQPHPKPGQQDQTPGQDKPGQADQQGDKANPQNQK
jgi:hypothetical protein